MKKHIVFTVLLFIALISLNGCTFTIIKDDHGETEDVFAVSDKEQVTDETSEKEEEEVDEKALPAYFPHEYTVESDEGEVLAPDGEVLATYSYSYPVFVSNEGDDAEYVDSINQMLKENAIGGTFVSNEEFDFLLDEYMQAKDNGWTWFGPFDYSYNFEIHADAKGILSGTETWYAYTGGVHGNAAKESHTFDVINGKKLSLSDLLYGTDEEITEAFTLEFLKVSDEFYPGNGPSAIVPEELPNAQYFVDGEGVTAYFQQYQVGPYAAGFVSATISDKEMLKFDFSDTAN